MSSRHQCADTLAGMACQAANKIFQPDKIMLSCFLPKRGQATPASFVC